ncbi:ROK family protein [Nostocoides sp. F2B08]|uniref:ROK family transcriptional regulator n=1 Tax=Nostocoides sp. F2B08 TaxID=2653936 RepID=UPI0012631779|nr:ROK family transcriptional regulator [Tetrasphaera sp. F2B08]KAB7745370.1 ROK family protein [Tetrasphaera sp. F2B08]
MSATTQPRAAQRSSRTAVRSAQTREHNLALVLRLVHAGGPTSRATIARGTGLTRPAVSDLVAELIDRGHLVETGMEEQNRPGKPGVLVDVNRSGRAVVALDLTAYESLRAAVLDLDGTVVVRLDRPLEQSEAGVDPQVVVDLALEAVAASPAPVLGVGVGSPGIVTSAGVITMAPNLGWTEVHLGAELALATGLPVEVCNDADAAVRAEYALGAGADDLLLIRIGRGLGAGLVVGGQPVRGAHGAAGEIGHVTVGTDGGRLCRCGRRGCLETWVSAPSLETALANPTEGGREAAVTEAGERLGIALAPIVAALDLGEVVIDGPEHLVIDELLLATERAVHDRILSRLPLDLTVRRSVQPGDIVLRGAAALVLGSQLGLV